MLYSLQSQNFFLLHLCLLREYLDIEFQDIEPQLSFPYNLERIIDDFVLLAVFVGNDFLPNLPDLHIHDNALERLFNIYKLILPQAGGYINNSGVIDVQRLQLILNALSESEVEVFHKEMGDVNWVKSKRKAPPPERRTGSLREYAISGSFKRCSNLQTQ
jgi:5'-3' exoribonuclease 1